MKNLLITIVVLVLALGALGVGVVFAQGGNPPAYPYGGMMGQGGMMTGGRGGYGPVHAYVVDAFASKLDLTADDVTARLAAGETMYQIALAEGITAEEMPAFMADIHKTAFDKAVAAGVMTQAQADFMLQRMAQNGYGTGTCPMGGGGYGQGRGMMGGGRWQTQNP